MQPAPSGLTDHSRALNLPRHLLQYLAQQLRPDWLQHHPNKPTGRPRVSFLTLLLGTLYYLRDHHTLDAAAAHVHISKGTLAEAYKEIVALIANLGICQADGTLLTPDLLEAWLSEMAAAGEIALVDGTDTQGLPSPRPIAVLGCATRHVRRKTQETCVQHDHVDDPVRGCSRGPWRVAWVYP